MSKVTRFDLSVKRYQMANRLMTKLDVAYDIPTPLRNAVRESLYEMYNKAANDVRDDKFNRVYKEVRGLNE